MNDNAASRRLWFILFVALLLVLLGSLLASYVQTVGGTVEIKDVRFVGTNGTLMSALLYIPSGATAETPAPGILAVHGYINSRETQDGFAIEFARRGYVVLALDQTGHGFSDPPAFANGFGGPDGLRYLRSLDIVDPDNIGLEGHSMGGWTSLAAAITYPEDYKSIVLEGSSTGAPFAADGTPEWPRNMALVFSEWDEFSLLMWGTPTGREIVNSDKLKAVFNTTDPVVIGQLYGSLEDGTARQLYMPRGTHPNDHISTEAIGNAIDWMQRTLAGGNGLAPSDQIWYWKEIGTFIAFVGLVIFLFPAGGLLLRLPYFSTMRQAVPAFKGATGIGWWVAVLISVVVSGLSFFWLQNQGNTLLPASAFFPQTITTGIMAWAVGNGLIALVLFLIWHFGLNRTSGATAAHYGLTWIEGFNLGKFFKAIVLAVCVIGLAYAVVAAVDWIFKTDFRLWVLALKPMSFLHFHIMLAYLIPFAFFFLVSSLVLNAQIRLVRDDGTPVGLGRAMLVNAVVLALPIVVMLLIQYIPLMGGQPLPLGESLLTIVGIQFVPLLMIVAAVSTYFFRKTGTVYTGAFINALFITWYIVAGQAIQFAL
ncbi:MAG: alpha/beta fold hydrolase [Chloroflexi bacterium]|nr:alpha/beta fold hydrolase [Chloroflexota bacterium]